VSADSQHQPTGDSDIVNVAIRYLRSHHPEWAALVGTSYEITETNELRSQSDGWFEEDEERCDWWCVRFPFDVRLPGLRGERPIVYIEKATMRAVFAKCF
jgi:hypothetical protein